MDNSINEKIKSTLSLNDLDSTMESLVINHFERIKLKLFDFVNVSPLIPLETKIDFFKESSLEKVSKLIISPNIVEILYVFELSKNSTSIEVLSHQLAEYILFEFDKGAMPCSALGDRFRDLNEKGIVLESGIVLDYNGYHHRNLGNGISAYSYEEAIDIKEKIDRAFREIELTSPLIANFIKSVTVQIEIRKNNNNFPCNSSGPMGIGKNRSENFHLRDDLYETMDFLVHETIHTYLHLIEEEHGRFITNDGLLQEWIGEDNIPSPWSKQVIDLSSYSHAILVWAGLSKFWKLVKHLDPDQTLRMRNQAEKGFLKELSPLEILGEKQQYLTNNYKSLIQNFCNESRPISL